MTNEELNTALYKKMFAEQEKFEDWLLSQSPREILNHAYEYTMREDILLSLEYNDLTSDQAAALLASPSPLDDLYHQYEKMETSHMEEIWSCFENRAEQVKAAQAVQEKRLNVSCKEAIEEAIDGSYKGNSLDAKAAAQEVLDKFGPDRVQTVPCCDGTGQGMGCPVLPREQSVGTDGAHAEGSEDGNRRSHWVVDSHPGLVNLFVDQVRDLAGNGRRKSRR